jgi:hypothetical protein
MNLIVFFDDFLQKEFNNTQIASEIYEILWRHNICPHIILKKLNYKIHKMPTFLPFHFHLLRELEVESL